MSPYAHPPGGLPPQDADLTGKAVFTEAYAVIPAGCMRDIVTSRLPGWEGTRLWVLARPMAGFAETFSHFAMEVAPGGGCGRPEPEAGVQAALFVTRGAMALTADGGEHRLEPGGFAWLPPGADWRVQNAGEGTLGFHWIRKRWQPADGVSPPAAFITSDQAVEPDPMPRTKGRWATTRFMDPDDLGHDMHITIVTLQPDARIPFEETHVMEHGLYVLQGQGRYLLNRDWVEVGPGDWMWLRAFCPQACTATGDEPFRYLLYKDVNRLAVL